MLVLDTTILSILEWSRTSPKGQRLAQRLDESRERVITTIVCCEEQMRGWMASLKSKPALKDQIEAYRRLRQRLENYRTMEILDFDEAAAAKFQELKKLRLRVGTMDLKIAAIVLVHHATVLTENVRDFGLVPGLQVEDWTRL
jgi:tRNA(fMet)-specific endonuclease VapC